MPLWDLSGEALRRHRCTTPEPEDFEAFWVGTLEAARSHARPVHVEPVDTGLPLVHTWDVELSGFGGHPVRAWWHVPAGVPGPVPVVVHAQGYGGGRGLPHQVPWFVLAGWACLEVDTRGQGSSYAVGDTPDPVGSGPSHPGFLTRGLLDPADHYYRRVYADTVRAVESVAELPGADATRVAVTGGSQGGGIALATAALLGLSPAATAPLRAVCADVPFLCDIRRGSEISSSAPYSEVAAYLAVHRDHAEQTFRTLSYIDAAVLATRATAPALFSVALMDQVCPPSTVYAAYNAYAGPKQIREYPFNDHEGGQAFHDRVIGDFLAEHLGS